MSQIFNYTLTNQVYNSNTTIAKIAKYSLVGIALVALVETIKNIVMYSFDMIANYNNLNDVIKKDQKKSESQKKDLDHVSESSNSRYKRNLKRIALIAVAALSGAAIGYWFFSPESVEEKLSRCQGVLANGFNALIKCQTKNDDLGVGFFDVNVPPLKPSAYTILQSNDSSYAEYASNHAPCIFRLTEVGKEAIKQSSELLSSQPSKCVTPFVLDAKVQGITPILWW
jgi:hypothetical protein